MAGGGRSSSCTAHIPRAAVHGAGHGAGASSLSVRVVLPGQGAAVTYFSNRPRSTAQCGSSPVSAVQAASSSTCATAAAAASAAAAAANSSSSSTRATVTTQTADVRRRETRQCRQHALRRGCIHTCCGTPGRRRRRAVACSRHSCCHHAQGAVAARVAGGCASKPATAAAVPARGGWPRCQGRCHREGSGACCGSRAGGPTCSSQASEQKSATPQQVLPRLQIHSTRLTPTRPTAHGRRWRRGSARRRRCIVW